MIMLYTIMRDKTAAFGSNYNMRNTRLLWLRSASKECFLVDNFAESKKEKVHWYITDNISYDYYKKNS